MTRKEFIKTGSAAATAAGFTGCLTASAGADKLALLGGEAKISRKAEAGLAHVFLGDSPAAR